MITPAMFISKLGALMSRHQLPILNHAETSIDLEVMLAALEERLKREAELDARAVAQVFNQIRAEALTTFVAVLVKEFGLSEKRVARAAKSTIDQLERIDAETVPEVAQLILEE